MLSDYRDGEWEENGKNDIQSSDLSNLGEDVTVCPKEKMWEVQQKKENFVLWHVEFESYPGRCPNKNVQKKKVIYGPGTQERALELRFGCHWYR